MSRESGKAMTGIDVSRTRPRKQEDHQHNERKGDKKCQLDVVDALENLNRAVVVDVSFDGCRKSVLQSSQRVSDRACHEDIVGARGRRDRDYQGGGARRHPARPEIYCQVLVLDAVNEFGDVPEPHRGAILIPDDQVLVVLGAAGAVLSD